jgi:branched-chain amino acid transport system permease protein
METILQLIVSGIALGCIYCLVAIEFSLIFNASGLINFGHDKFIMLGAYIFGGTMINHLGVHFFLAFVVASALMGVFGAAAAAGIFNPLRNMPSDLYAVMGTIMLAKILGEVARLIWGPQPFTVENFLVGTVRVGDVALPRASIYIIVVSVLFLYLQNLLFKKTKIGKAMRCVAQDKVAAAIMGINVSRNIMLTVAFSSVICGIIGIMIIPVFHVEVNMANMIGLKGFAASVVGGFGTVAGAIAGGLFIGLSENIYLIFGPGIYKDVVAFVLLILFLLIRPDGIVSRTSR